MPARRLRTLAAIALASSALVVAGCGDDDETTAATTGATTMAMTADGPSQTTASGTIVDVAAGNPDFSILVAAVQRAGLAETLSGAGPFTVFAPTNAAFEAALSDLGLTQEQLLESPQLERILTYHVLPARVAAGDVTGELTPETVEGAQLPVRAEGGEVRVGEDATVVQADVEASNGVIHAIDRVLIPPDVDLG
ncbi:MAG TPA: fasciclin domain-containing protein [Miltoncostaeaceae bacterium]|nr:fasciclin domain-containing protein [Miltoncostaeaceae bacterium]